jgi:hypothetical protein
VYCIKALGHFWRSYDHDKMWSFLFMSISTKIAMIIYKSAHILVALIKTVIYYIKDFMSKPHDKQRK